MLEGSAQSAHACAPAGAAVPSPQSAHEYAPMAPKRPAAQTHWLALVAPPCSVVWLAPHATQPAPLADQVPAAHVTQAVKGEMEPAAPAWPAPAKPP